jgi:O-acetyl-ADP-ribose deacetylase (regulator of RNase III)
VLQNALTAAATHQCRTVAVPAISTGAYRFPIERAAVIALQTAAEFLQENELPEVVRFVLYKQPQYDVFASQLGQLTV